MHVQADVCARIHMLEGDTHTHTHTRRKTETEGGRGTETEGGRGTEGEGETESGGDGDRQTIMSTQKVNEESVGSSQVVVPQHGIVLCERVWRYMVHVHANAASAFRQLAFVR